MAATRMSPPCSKYNNTHYEFPHLERRLRETVYGGTLSMALPLGCFYAAVTEKCTGAPNHHSFCEEGHPLGMRVTPLAAGTLH